jgi:hypothetical protein
MFLHLTVFNSLSLSLCLFFCSLLIFSFLYYTHFPDSVFSSQTLSSPVVMLLLGGHLLRDFSTSVLSDLTGVTGDAERTKDRRKTCIKLGSGVLGTHMEMPKSLITSFLYYSLLLLCFSLFFKILLLKSFFFSILKVSYLRLTLSHVFFNLS